MAERVFQTDPDEYFLFCLALELGRTVGELRPALSTREFTQWAAFFNERKRREDEEADNARGQRH